VINQVRLINGSKRTIKVGDPCKLHATKKNSFDYAELGDIVIGTAAVQVFQGGWGVLNLQGTVLWENVLNKPPRGVKITIDIEEPAGPNVAGDLWVIPSQI
jgi:hypothetical protein